MCGHILDVRDGDVVLVGYPNPNAVHHGNLEGALKTLGVDTVQLLSVHSDTLAVTILRRDMDDL